MWQGRKTNSRSSEKIEERSSSDEISGEGGLCEVGEEKLLVGGRLMMSGLDAEWGPYDCQRPLTNKLKLK